ncbi:hypothetical protein D3C85_477270 [compost metagenome]
MSLSAIEQRGPVRADEARDPYLAERVGVHTRADRAARTQSASFERIHAARKLAAATAAPAPKAVTESEDTPGAPIDRLRDQYVAHCLMSAILAFRKEQATLQERADAANDLGTIQGLLPLQPYRIALGDPHIQPQQVAAAASVAPAMVGPVANMAALRNATDDALGTHPATRARTRRPREPQP